MLPSVDREWVTPAEAAKILGCSRARVFALGKAGQIARREVGGTVEHPRWAYSAASVERYRAALDVVDLVRASTRAT